MSHLEENSSFDDEYWDMVHGAQPLPPLRVFLGEGQTGAGSGLQEPFHKGPLPAAAVPAKGSAVFCRIEDK